MKILLDLERTVTSGMATYWKPGQLGYTQDVNQAGRYSDETADRIVQDDFDQRTVAIDTRVIDRLTRKAL